MAVTPEVLRFEFLADAVEVATGVHDDGRFEGSSTTMEQLQPSGPTGNAVIFTKCVL